ncbi:uncharacterized protein IWZ02DRAFT_450373 [Phyllosticta citriasiana]|uniref:Uncharacterized protein n=1 Tax=Phyllosticta citriasiana TaxID=595635 RepID=A0ABR1KSP2_9PEZI
MFCSFPSPSFSEPRLLSPPSSMPENTSNSAYRLLPVAETEAAFSKQEQDFRSSRNDLEDARPVPSPRKKPQRPWQIATAVLALTNVAQFFDRRNVFHSKPSLNGLRAPTDFPSIPSHIFEPTERRFEYPFRMYENGTLYGIKDPEASRFVGPPSEERDKAWNDLTSPRYFALTDTEADTINGMHDSSKGDDPHVYPITGLPHAAGMEDKEGKRYAGVDVLHNLHCLNMLRKHVDDVNFYQTDGTGGGEATHGKTHSHEIQPGFERVHIDHCINQIREALMCGADVTPVSIKATEWKTVEEGEEKTSILLIGETERRHSCRDFGALRSWVADMTRERGYLF